MQQIVCVLTINMKIRGLVLGAGLHMYCLEMLQENARAFKRASLFAPLYCSLSASMKDI